MGRGKGKSAKGDKEYSQVQKLVYENRELQKEVNKLRRQLEQSKMEICPHCMHDEPRPNKNKKAKNEEVPAEKGQFCFVCGKKSEHSITKYPKGPSETWFFTSCGVCGERTAPKKMSSTESD